MQRELTAAPQPPAVAWQARPVLGNRATHLAVLVLYLALALLLTYPLVTHLTTGVPGPPAENGVWLYDLWRTRVTFSELGRTGAVPYAGSRPAAASVGVANHLLALPWLLLGGEVLAYNMVALLSFILTAYATFCYALYVTRNPYAAAVSGAILAFSPLRMHWLAAGALPLLATQWLPLSLFFLERAIREHRRRYAALAGIALGLAMLTTWGAALVAAGRAPLRPGGYRPGGPAPTAPPAGPSSPAPSSPWVGIVVLLGILALGAAGCPRGSTTCSSAPTTPCGASALPACARPGRPACRDSPTWDSSPRSWPSWG